MNKKEFILAGLIEEFNEGLGGRDYLNGILDLIIMVNKEVE